MHLRGIFKQTFLIFFMVAELCLIPEKCGKCGEVFDLKYDLEGTGSIGEIIRDMPKTFANRKATLCWYCRIEKR